MTSSPVSPPERKERATALITGVTGQDGALLARHLLDSGYSVIGTTRAAHAEPGGNLQAMGLNREIELVAGFDPSDRAQVFRLVDATRPVQIYHLAGQTSVGRSFAIPAETTRSNVAGTLHLLEAIREISPDSRMFHPSSGECFGDLAGDAATEDTLFHPTSPYAVSKVAAHQLVSDFRASHGLFVVNGILFNHESPLRPEAFVTRKIARGVAAIVSAEGKGRLALGRMDIVRDWGWAPEYVVAMHAMLTREVPKDFVIATGNPISLADFVEAAFAAVDLDWRDHVDLDPAFVRPSDPGWTAGNPERAERELGWHPTVTGRAVAEAMVRAELSGPGWPDAPRGSATR